MDPSSPRPADPDRRSWAFILVVLLILVGFGLTAFYGTRLLVAYRLLHHHRLQPGTTDVSLVRSWMTLPYIARAYRVPEEVLWRGLGIPEQGNRNKNLRALDRQYANGQPGATLSRVRAILSQYLSEHPGAPATPTP